MFPKITGMFTSTVIIRKAPITTMVGDLLGDGTTARVGAGVGMPGMILIGAGDIRDIIILIIMAAIMVVIIIRTIIATAAIALPIPTTVTEEEAIHPTADVCREPEIMQIPVRQETMMLTEETIHPGVIHPVPPSIRGMLQPEEMLLRTKEVAAVNILMTEQPVGLLIMEHAVLPMPSTREVPARKEMPITILLLAQV